MKNQRQQQGVTLKEPDGAQVFGPSLAGHVWTILPEAKLHAILAARLSPGKDGSDVLHELICRGLECERLHGSK